MNKKQRKNHTAASLLPGIEFMHMLDLALKFILTIVAIMLAALFFIFVHDYLTQSSLFAIHEISVTGCRHLTPEQVQNHGGVHGGQNLLALNTTLLRKKLMAHPWIKTARIHRTFPHGLEISITEQIPLARVTVDDKPPLLINDRGEPFTRLSSPQSDDLPRLPLIKGLLLTRKQGRSGFHGPVMQSVLTLLATDMGFSYTTITADRDTGLTAEVLSAPHGQQPDSPQTIRMQLGHPPFGPKLKVAKTVIRYIHQQQMDVPIAAMDLYTPERVVVTPGTAVRHEGTQGV